MEYKLGKQYDKDDSFKASARLHQSRYRSSVLQVDYNEYGNRLTDADGKYLLNYYDGLGVRSARQHLIGMSRRFVHRSKDLLDEVVRYIFVKQITHRIHEYQTWFFPLIRDAQCIWVAGRFEAVDILRLSATK